MKTTAIVNYELPEIPGYASVQKTLINPRILGINLLHWLVVKLCSCTTFYEMYCLFVVVRDTSLHHIIMFRSYQQKNVGIMVICRDERLWFLFIYQNDLFGGD